MIIAVVVIIWLLIKGKEKDGKIEALELLVKTNEALNNEIKAKLEELIQRHPDIDENISGELQQIAELLKIQQNTKAALALAKIIENLLKKLYETDDNFKTQFNKKKPGFHDYLKHAFEKGDISNQDFHLVAALKYIRNEEAHELNVKKEKSKLSACILAGIRKTITLYDLVREKVGGLQNNSSSLLQSVTVVQ
jgi:hypothetical protein